MPAAACAIVVHVSPGRARLRVPERLGDREFFATLEEALRAEPSVREVRSNPITGSVLIQHDEPLEPILAYLSRIELLETLPRRAVRSAVHALQMALERGNARLLHHSRGALSFETLSFFGMLAAGVYQLRRGKFLPAGMTLFTYALESLEREARRDTESTTGEPPS
jgi:hypothetical protein